MAILTGEIQFTGSIGNLSAYRLKASGKIVIRQKGGPDRDKLKFDKNFAVTRLYNNEWAGCIMARKQLSKVLFPVKHLADYAYASALNGLCKSIQKDDTVNELGRRSVLFSPSLYKLEGFSLNRIRPFESFLKHPLQYSIDKPNFSAAVKLPAILPGISFINPENRPFYRFVFVLGLVTDIIYDPERKIYMPADKKEIFPAVSYTNWKTSTQKTEPASIMLRLEDKPDHTHYSLLLAAGIEFGMPVSSTEINPSRQAGAARILKME